MYRCTYKPDWGVVSWVGGCARVGSHEALGLLSQEAYLQDRWGLHTYTQVITLRTSLRTSSLSKTKCKAFSHSQKHMPLMCTAFLLTPTGPVIGFKLRVCDFAKSGSMVFFINHTWTQAIVCLRGEQVNLLALRSFALLHTVPTAVYGWALQLTVGADCLFAKLFAKLWPITAAVATPWCEGHLLC